MGQGNGSKLSQMKIGSTVLNFAYDASGTPMAVTYGGATYYYATNIQGDVVAILNASGTAVVTYTYDAWGNILTTTGTLASTLGTHNPLRYRGYVYDQETGLYYLQSRYYNPALARFLNADSFVSTGQGLLGNNMFAYCRNNPVVRIDIYGSADTAVEEEFDDDVEVTPAIPIDGGGGGGGIGGSGNGGIVGTAGNGGSGPSGFAITVGSSGIAATPNPNNEPTERHHIVEQCQVKKSGFVEVDIQGNSNLIDLPYAVHRKISGLYSSKQPYSEGMRVRDWLATKSFEYQHQFGLDKIAEIWRDLYDR